MRKKLEIKVCGNTQHSNLQKVCDLQPEYIGLIFYPGSRRYVSSENNLTQPLSCEAKRVGVFVNASLEEISEKIGLYQLDFVQLHGDENPDFCAKINEIRPVFKVFQVNKLFKFTQVNNYLSTSYRFLFDTSSNTYGGSGRKFDWKLLSRYELSTPFFLSGGIRPEDVQSILNLNHPQLAGVDLNSGFEVSPGIKDIDKLKVFFNQLRGL